MRRRDWMKMTAGAALAPAAWAAEEGIPAHPGELAFPTLTYDPPKPADYRHELPEGAVAYVVEDHQLPLIDISVTIRTGGYLVPKDMKGLASFTGSQIRAGGTKTLSAREFDEQAAFLASELSSGISSTAASAGFNCITQNLKPTLKMFFDMLKNPGFDAERFQISVARRLQSMQRRNDQAQSVENREFSRLMRGDDHYSTWPSTQASIEAVTIEAMREFHAKYYHPGSMIFSVAGDVNTEEILEMLGNELTDGWQAASKPEIPDVPVPNHTPTPGVYMVDKPELNQSRIAMGHLGILRDDPDRIALGVLDDILGAGGFTSRIMMRVRSDEGLAYSAGSGFRPGLYYPGTFQAGFQSMNARCAQATTIVIEEINRIREEKVTDEELTTAKNSSIEIFPRFFATATAIAGTFASDEYTDREEGYWDKYRDRIAAVTKDDLLRVAQKHLHPDKLVILGVGNAAEMLAGNPDKPEYQFSKLAGDREIKRIPLPDPMTMEYPQS